MDVKKGDLVRLNGTYYVREEEKGKTFRVLSEPADAFGVEYVRLLGYKQRVYPTSGLDVVDMEKEKDGRNKA